MKRTKCLNHLFFTFLVLILTSCGDNKSSDISSKQNIKSEENLKPIPENTENTATVPCEFSLSNIKANEIISIDCIIDLKGETVNIPKNVTLSFNKGDIINGTLNFRARGKIAGELLSSKLTLKGDVELTKPIFKFFASRWGIIEGPTTSDIAFANNKKLESLFFYIKGLGGTTFKINKFDAFFEVTRITPPEVFFRASNEGLNIPSNFTLEMTDNTFLRAFPAEADKENGTILAINDVDNSIIKGGNLIGDRNTRAYLQGDVGHMGSHLIHIQSGRNIILDNIKFINGSKGGLTIYSKGFSINPETYKPSTKITVKNCLFKDNRRMSISLTDGRMIFIENNTFINTGQTSTNSNGGEVGYAINIEAGRRRNENGDLEELQKVFDVIVRRNTETNSRSGFITINIGQNTTVEENNIGTRVSYKFTNNSKILNNTFKANGIGLESWAIFASGIGETVFKNEVAGNIISGYKTGIIVASNEAFIHDNTIKNVAVGIQLSKANNPLIANNTITSGKGITATNTYVNNGEIKGNHITTNGFHMFFSGLNTENAATQNYTVRIVENTFINPKKVTISNTSGVVFAKNKVIGGIEVGNSSRIEVSGNTKIQPDESDGIRVFGTNNDISILNNIISEPTGNSRFNCINNNSKDPESITLTNNSCIN